MIPAQQRLVAEHIAGLERHDRLEVRFEFAAHQGTPQVALEIQRAHRFGAQMLVEDGVALATPGLCPIHGRVGVAQQFFGARVMGIGIGDADAGRGEHFLVGDTDGVVQTFEYALGDMDRELGFGQIVDQYGKFITTEPGDHVRRAGAGQAQGRLLEHLVADQMADAVVDHLEAIEIEKQHCIASGGIILVAGQRRAEPLQQQGPIRQSGQHIMEGLVGQPGLDSLAFEDLRGQVTVGMGQGPGTLLDAGFQLHVVVDQRILRALALEAVGDMVGDEGQQFLVAHGKRRVGRVALHGKHAYGPLVADQGNAEPVARPRTETLDVARADQFIDAGAIGKQGAAGPQHVLGHAVGHRPARPHRIDLVDRIRKFQLLAAIGNQGDVEIARVQQLADDGVDAGVEILHRFAGSRAFGDAKKGALQALAALPLGDLLLQLLIGLGQLLGTLGDTLFEFGLGLLALEGGQDVLGHVVEDGAVFLGIARVGKVALHDDRPADRGRRADHRYAEPVLAVGAEPFVARDIELGANLRRGSHLRLAAAQHGQGDAARQVAGGNLVIGIEDVAVDGVDEIEEAQAVALGFVQRDEEVLGVHEPADDLVDAAQHVGHVEIGTGHVGDREQGPLHVLGALEPANRVGQRIPLEQTFGNIGDIGQKLVPFASAGCGNAVSGPPGQFGTRPVRCTEQRNAADFGPFQIDIG